MWLTKKVNEAVEIHNFAGSDTGIAGDRGSHNPAEDVNRFRTGYS
jgi:hypothetical protein